MGKRSVKNIRDLPDWFNIEKYAVAKELDAYGWLTQLNIRSDALLLGPHDKHFREEAYRKIREQPIANQDTDLRYYFLQEEYKSPLGRFACIRSLGRYQGYSFMKYQSWGAILEGLIKSIDQAPADRKRIAALKTVNDIFEEYSQETSQRYDPFPWAYLTIDLMASEEQLIGEFKSWLKGARKSIDTDYPLRKKMIGNKEFKKWINAAILPYLDLTIWAKEEHLQIPFHILGTAIFPDEYEVNLAEKVRKVTKPHAEEALSWETYNALHRQCQN